MAATDEEQDYARLKWLFGEVCDLADTDAQRQRLAELAVEPEFAARVLALLHSAGPSTAHFAAPAARALAAAVDAAPEGAPGDVLGHWTLLRELGAGGMGRVFLAERNDGHFSQRAAVKLLRGWASTEALARLAQERQILASLAHPNIARLLDGGATPRGAPYLVIEYIEGVPIDEAARRRGLGADAVIRLLLAVCDALAYAHRQFVVHCDIKPSNVLVDAEGRVHLLDFGIAHLLGHDGDGTQAVAMTPHYASPEQAAGATPGPASDIYSLGRVLEELLTLPQVAARRPGEWRALVARATAADPAARYVDVPSFARDLENYLGQRPLAALPRRWRYVAAKFVRRRWGWVLAATGVLALSVGFTLQLLNERDAAIAARLQAEREASTTRRISDFAISLFDGADPRITGRPDLPATALVDQGRRRVDIELAERPALQAEMKAVLARVYDSIGQLKSSIALYHEVVALEARPDVQRPLREAEALSRLAAALGNDHQEVAAEAPARRALELRRRHGAAPLVVADSHNSLGLVLAFLRRPDEAREHLNLALSTRRALLEPGHLEIGVTLHNLGVMAERTEANAAAEQYFRQALQTKRVGLAPTHPSVLNSEEMLAVVLGRQHRFDDAQAQFRRLIELRKQVFGESSGPVLRTQAELASTLQDAGRLDEAIVMYRLALAGQSQLFGARSMRVAVTSNNLASALALMGDVAAAETAWRESLAIRQEAPSPDALSIGRVQHHLGSLLLAGGRWADARPLLQAALAARETRLPPGHGERLDTLTALAELALAERDPLAAAQVAALPEPRPDDERAGMRGAALRRVQALAAARAGHADDALALHTQAWQRATAAVGEAHPLAARYALDLAEALAARGDLQQAAALLAPRLPLLMAQAPESPLRRRASQLQARLRRG